jgi:ppGpp synthetase/RelA/SpoT-type nucleotidyltranferase
MAWTKPQFGKGRVDAAGDILLKPNPSELEYAEALACINNWRSSHSYPLQALKMTLLGRAKKIDKDAVVAQRLKRLSSITLKLERNSNMKLSQMQDIGGCRAVVSTVERVTTLVGKYEESWAKNPKDRSELVKKYDYIAQPKLDGYRSVHFVYKYRSRAKEYLPYNGLRIEIQLRSRLQHAWATAVETVSTFTGQALKSNVGDDDWKRFFALMGSAIAMREQKPTVPGTPTNKEDLVEELRLLSDRLNIESVLADWSSAIQIALTERIKAGDAQAFLLVLNSNARTIEITGFRRSELLQASEEYLLVETHTANKPEVQAVLVSVDSLAALRSAYPNYYLDTRAFIAALKIAIGSKGSHQRRSKQ